MNRSWEMVREFHIRFDAPHADRPRLLETDRVEKRKRWLAEELEEFQQARTIEEQADAMIDVIYLALGTLVEMGVRPEALFEIVHEANMSKLWPDGKPRVRKTDGKVIKPPEWKDPGTRIRLEIQRQQKERNK